MKCGIELTFRYGPYGEKTKSIALPLSEGLERELQEPVELSDSPFSLLLASPAFWTGDAKSGNAVTTRLKSFAMRKEVAKEIGRLVADALPELWGSGDRVDGYRKDQLTDYELHKRGLKR